MEEVRREYGLTNEVVKNTGTKGDPTIWREEHEYIDSRDVLNTLTVGEVKYIFRTSQ